MISYKKVLTLKKRCKNLLTRIKVTTWALIPLVDEGTPLRDFDGVVNFCLEFFTWLQTELVDINYGMTIVENPPIL